MASIHRQKDRKNWYVIYFDQHGVRHHKSTRTPRRKLAEAAAQRIQNLVMEARKSAEFTKDRVQEMLRETFREIALLSGVEMDHQSIQDYFRTWLEDKKDSSEGTMTRYRGIVQAFLKFLGPKGKGSLASLSEGDIQRFRDELEKNVSAGTVNTYLKVIRTALNKAVKKNALTKNPADPVDNLSRRNKQRREPFTMEQFKDLFKNASQDWKTMLATGLYTGLRLSDCANMTALNLDLVEGCYKLREKKTDRYRIIPIAKPLQTYLEGLDLGDNPQAPLCPKLYGKPESWLSNQFYDLMASTGLVPARDHRSKEKGRGSRRTQSPLTFHSLRYTATSELKSAGVADAIARDIIGHESEAVSRNYTYISESAKRDALNKLPQDALK